MKALTLWQPWASLIAVGAKKYETRSRATNYRGPIAIHAGLTPFRRVLKKMFPLHEWSYAPDYTLKRRFVALVSKYVDIDALCYGAVIATAELVGCYLIELSANGTSVIFQKDGDMWLDKITIRDDEFLFGDWTPGRYAWELANVQKLPKPIPAKGKQGLWNWEDVK